MPSFSVLPEFEAFLFSDSALVSQSLTLSAKVAQASRLRLPNSRKH